MNSRCEQFRYDLEQKDSNHELTIKLIAERHSRTLAARDEQLMDLQSKFKLDLAKAQADHEQKLNLNNESNSKTVQALQVQFN